MTFRAYFELDLESETDVKVKPHCFALQRDGRRAIAMYSPYYLDAIFLGWSLLEIGRHNVVHTFGTESVLFELNVKQEIVVIEKMIVLSPAKSIGG